MSVNEKMTAIADAIRGKTGIAGKLTLDDMAAEIDAVHESGKKTEYDAFWDTYQENGTRTDYSYAFAGVGWTSETYKPKYPMQPTASQMMYIYSNVAGHIDIDTSLSTNFQQMFQSSKITSLGVIDTRNASAFARTFQSGTLKSIEKLILKDDGSQTFSNTFYGSNSLTDIVIEGTIGQNIDFGKSAKLTHDSLMSIINALQAKTSGSWSVTLGTTNLAKLTDAEKAIATQKGWTLV